MSAPLIAFPAFHDLKMRNSKGGGISDGGVVCISQPLSASPYYLQPRPGTALRAFSTRTGMGEFPLDNNVSLCFMNFDPDTPVDVEMNWVFEDGSSLFFRKETVPAHTSPEVGVIGIPWLGIILTYPNKIGLKLVSSSGYALPTKRVLFKACLLELDKPGDLG